MKIEFTQHRQLDELGITVTPGDTLQSPEVDDRLMAAYVQNGIAVDVSPGRTEVVQPKIEEPKSEEVVTDGR